MKYPIYAPLLAILLIALTTPMAQARSYIRAYGGVSWMSESDFEQDGLANQGANAELAAGAGWNAGVALGRVINKNLFAEIAWDYRTNSQDTLKFSDFSNDVSVGNYQSSIFFLNSHYYIGNIQSARPYIGGGVGWVQDVSLDLGGQEFSGDNRLAYQLYGGFAIPLGQKVNLMAEFGRIWLHNEVDLQSSSSNAVIRNFDYEPYTGRLALQFLF